MGCACVSPMNATDTVTSSHHGTPHHAGADGDASHTIHGGSPVHDTTHGHTNNPSFRSSNAAAMAALASSSNTIGKPPDANLIQHTNTNGHINGTLSSTNKDHRNSHDILVPGQPHHDTPEHHMTTGKTTNIDKSNGHGPPPTTRSATAEEQHDNLRPNQYLATDAHGRPYSRSGVNHITSATEKGPSQSQSPVDYKVSVAPLDEKTLRDRKTRVMGAQDHRVTNVTMTSQSQGTITSVSRGPTIDIDESGQPAPSSSMPPKSAAAAILAAPVATRSSSASVTTHDRGQQRQHHHQHGHHHNHTHHGHHPHHVQQQQPNGQHGSGSNGNGMANGATNTNTAGAGTSSHRSHHDASSAAANNGHGNGHPNGATNGVVGGNARKEYRASISEDDWLHGTVKALSDVEALKKDAEIMTGSDAPPIMTAFALLQSTNRRNILTTMNGGHGHGNSLSPMAHAASSSSSSVHSRTKSAPPAAPVVTSPVSPVTAVPVSSDTTATTAGAAAIASSSS